jgi:cytoskeletal protein RodZ
MEPKGTFGPRLRQERERRQISLASIATNTKISQSLLEALERDDVSRWPSGIFRRSFIRSYAQAIGLDGDEIVREFAERFPDPSNPPVLSEPAPPPAPSPVSSIDAAEPPASGPASPDRVQLVFRINVPRTLALWVTRVTTWMGTMPRRQNT